jgi:malate synthase
MPEGLKIRKKVTGPHAEILTPAALDFLTELARHFEPMRQELLQKRAERQKELDAGTNPDFLASTKKIRESGWRVAEIPRDLTDRRVEITGPVERKMMINAFNSGASVFMADFEDAHSPTWQNTLDGAINLRDAVRGTISFQSPEGKLYKLNEQTATLMVRPRGWHLAEKHVTIDERPMSGSLFDFGLSFFHNARALLERGTGPYFYLPKLESHIEARLWNDVFNFAQDRLSIPRGTIRATVLIETILAAFEMEEILYQLRDHSAGLNCGRWDYIFSFIKKFRNRRDSLLPDRAQVTMDKAFLKAYVDLLIQTCHRRGAHAMGGMAAEIPIKSDPAANEAALEKVRQDKLREVRAGHDGTWVAHPGLVPVAKEVFDTHMKGPNQLGVSRSEVRITPENLLEVPKGEITDKGLRTNIEVGMRYLEAWLRGSGCVPIHHLMEDAATAEISRSQVWQWIRHRARTGQGETITREHVARLAREELEGIRKSAGEDYARSEFPRAAELFERVATQSEFPEFLTLAAYEYLD